VFPEVFKAFQWHGDTFDLPKDAQLVFSNDIYTNQGFICKNAVGLQFHIEVSQNMIKQWMQEYKDEILEEKLNPDKIITEAEIYIPNLKTYLYDFLDRFLNERK
jgi:hypothetical protein